MNKPAHKVIVHQYLQQTKVKERLSRYNHINKYYPFDELMRWSDKEPYYCHYLAWRLGTWPDTQWFEFFDELLAHSSLLEGWNNGETKKSLLKNYKFEIFWHFLWELQVAKFFSEMKGVNVKWLNSDPERAPDLEITTDKGQFFVECYTFTKSFNIIAFIEELCSEIDPRIKVKHTLFNKLSLRKDSLTDADLDLDSLLDKIFHPLLNWNTQSDESAQESRILFSDPSVENFIIYLQGDKPINWPSDMFAKMMGEGPEKHLNIAIGEALGNKVVRDENNKLVRLKNGLDKDKYRPHLLAVNFVLSSDYQSALFPKIYLGKELSLDVFGKPDDWQMYDGVLLTTCGFNEIPKVDKYRSYLKCNHNHPILALW